MAPWWAPRSSWEADMLWTQARTALPAIDLEKETVITDRVVDGDGQAVGGAFVRLLNEFTAEAVDHRRFRFFAARILDAARAVGLPAGERGGAALGQITDS